MEQLPPPRQPQGMDKTAMLLMGLLLMGMFGYQTFIYAPAKRKTDARKAKEQAELEKEQAKAGLAPVGSATPAPVDSRLVAQGGSAQEPAQVQEPRQAVQVAATGHEHKEGISFSTAEHEITLNTAGASVDALILKNVKETVYMPKQSAEADARKPDAYQPLRNYGVETVRSFALEPQDHPSLAYQNWRHRELSGGNHAFSIETPDGKLRITKTYLKPGLPAASDEGEAPRDFHFFLRVKVENISPDPVDFGYRLNASAGMLEQEVGRSSYGQETALATIDNFGKIDDLEVTSVRGFEALGPKSEDVTLSKSEGDTEIAYFGLVTKYFAAVIVPTEGRKPTWSLPTASCS